MRADAQASASPLPSCHRCHSSRQIALIKMSEFHLDLRVTDWPFPVQDLMGPIDVAACSLRRSC